MRSLTLLAGLAGAAALAGSDLQAQNPNPWAWRGTVASGRTLEVRGIRGWIHAERSDGEEIEVTAQKTASRGNPGEVRILLTEDEDGVLICALYPGRLSNGGPANYCGRDGDRQSTEGYHDVAVQYTVRIPDGVDFVGGMIEGDVVLETSSGDATASSVSGDLNVTIHGRSGRPLHFRTISGNITLALPRDIDADVELTTLSGALRSFFPLSQRGRISWGGAPWPALRTAPACND